MTAAAFKDNENRVARALGLKVPVYMHLRESFARGEDPVWLRTADPLLAGSFPNPFGFEVLCDRISVEESLGRRRLNLLRMLEEKGKPEIVGSVTEAADDGELEDLALALEPSPAPDGWEPPEKEEHRAFLEKMRGDVGLARDLRRLFREKVVVVVGLQESKRPEHRHYAQFDGYQEPLLSLPPAKYLQLRRGEHLHALKLRFELPPKELRVLFDAGLEGVQPQEKEAYFKLFQEFVDRERLPRFAQEARARLKRNAENITLQQAWHQLETALDRGRHDGFVLGICALRGQKLMLALIDREGHILRTTALPAKAGDLAERLRDFLRDEFPTLVGVQADAATRAAAQPALDKLRKEGRLRSAPVPLAVVRTMLREVARRPEETHLTHDERQALLLARLAWHPRAAAYHTPHLVRAYIPYRGEINPRRLEHFECNFLQSMLLEKGVELNSCTRDELRLVPRLDADAVLFERSTAPFRSLEDFQARMGLKPEDWRAAACFLRVRRGDEILDARPLHPVYYTLVKRLAGEKELRHAELVKDPSKLDELAWEPALEELKWPKAVVDHVRQGLSRPSRRPRRPGHRPPEGQRLESLEVGATLRGTVSSLLPYGAFVNVGARREGLVHISEMADRFVKDPSEVVQVGEEVTVRVLSVDIENQRFRLSMRQPSEEGAQGSKQDGGPPGRAAEPGPGQRGRGQSGQGGRGGRPGQGGRGRPGQGGRGGAGGRGGPGGRGGSRREESWSGPDPRAKKAEEIDPTNPFYQFFKENKLPAGSDSEDKDGES